MIRLTAISSFRPMGDSKEVARNQINAKRSWDAVFDEIVYYGAKDLSLDSGNTFFINAPDFPPIVLLMIGASLADGPTCIINADIIVAPSLKRIITEAFLKGHMAMTSQRYEFDPERMDFDRAKVVDLGIDFFCATPEIWADAAQRIQKDMRVGHPGWDGWLSSYFNTVLREKYVSLVNHRLIFHPKHADRKRPHYVKVAHDHWSNRPGFPRAY